MTDAPTGGPSTQPVRRRRGVRPAESLRRLRAAHPVEQLRRMRAGVLAMVCATAVVYLLVATDGSEQITTARRVDAAVHDIKAARAAANSADKALRDAASTGQLDLIGTGNAFPNFIARISTLLTSAAQGNAAGAAGRAQFQFVQGQATTCLLGVDTAVRYYPSSGNAGVEAAGTCLTASRMTDSATGAPIPGTGGLMDSLDDLAQLQKSGLGRERDAGWLDPVQLWSVACAPLVLMLLFLLGTTQVVMRHFHRHVSPFLLAAFALTAAVTAAAGVLTVLDEHTLAAEPTAGHPVTMALALLVLFGAGVLNHLAYRPRLAEYRFPRP